MILLVGLHFQPIVKTADHDRANRTHKVIGETLLFAPRDRARLPPPRPRTAARKGYGGVDAHALRRGFLNGGDASAGCRDLDDHVGRESVEPHGLLDERLCIAVKSWVCLDGEPAVPPC